VDNDIKIIKNMEENIYCNLSDVDIGCFFEYENSLYIKLEKEEKNRTIPIYNFANKLIKHLFQNCVVCKCSEIEIKYKLEQKKNIF